MDQLISREDSEDSWKLPDGKGHGPAPNAMVVKRWSTTCLVSTTPVSGRDARSHSDADPPGRMNSTKTHSAVFAQALSVKRSWRHAHGIHSNFKTWMLCVVKFLDAASLCKDGVTFALPALVGFLLQNQSLLDCTSQCHGCPNSTFGKLKGWKLEVLSPKRPAICNGLPTQQLPFESLESSEHNAPEMCMDQVHDHLEVH